MAKSMKKSGSPMKAMKAMKALKAMKAMKAAKPVKVMKSTEQSFKPVDCSRLRMMKLPPSELCRRFESDLDEAYAEFQDMVSYNQSFRAPPPCTWRKFPGTTINVSMCSINQAFNAC